MKVLHWKQIKMLGFLFDNPSCSGTDVARELKITYSYVNDFVELLDDEGLLRKGDNGGRVKPLFLTKEGRLLAQKCSELVHTMELLNMVGGSR
jgi:DNA-binding MarR family transcriptional regulator